MEGRRRTPPDPCPEEWIGWDSDLEDYAMASQFGWTLEYIDSLDGEERARVRRMWAVKFIHDTADRDFAKWSKTQAQTMQNLDMLKVGKMVVPK